jgi:hypothetical protein
MSSTTREPDHATPITRRWAAPFDRDKAPATVAVWLIDAPWAHPLWDYHAVFIVHLRGDVDGKPAALQFPGATHEFAVVALDPGYQPNPDQPEDWRWLNPLSICQQFIAESDAVAVQKIEQLLLRVDRASLTVDSDGRSAWRRLLLEQRQEEEPCPVQ